MLPVKRLVSLALAASISGFAGAQVVAPHPAPHPAANPDRLDAVDYAARMARIALTGDLGLPALPPVLEDSPRDSLLFSDRFPVNQDPGAADTEGGTPTMFQGFIPSGPGGTGTDKNEIFEYQLGNAYDEFGAPMPLVVAYHGYGASAASVANQSTIDEECNVRGWVYLAPTGIDDKLFGAPVCQQNVQAAIQWMLDTYNVDPDRIYMVGFSLGGGIVSNFTARRRDPDGMMIAALGLVSGTYDWTISYSEGSAALKALLENPYNFGGNPTTFPFRYEQASDLHFRVGSYPPLPGALEPEHSMATNLGSTPIYHTWDTGDPLAEASSENPVMGAVLSNLGGTYTQVITSGTVDPVTLLPAPHSWAVLDEVELFDFFDGKTANRTPTGFSAQLDLPAGVSFTDVTQITTGQFSYVDAASDRGLDMLTFQNVKNVDDITADLGDGGLTTTGPIELYADSADASGFRLKLTDFTGHPAYLVDVTSGALVPGTESDPLTGSLIRQIAGATTLHANVISEPNWRTSLYTSPDPVAPGGALSMFLDAPDAATHSLLLVGTFEALGNIPGGNKVTVGFGPGVLLLDVPLDGNGDLTLPATIPNNPIYSGLSLRVQSIDINAGAQVESISNMWVLHIQ